MWPFRKNPQPAPAGPERQDESVTAEPQTPEYSERLAEPDDYPATDAADSGVHALPEPRSDRPACPDCSGTGSCTGCFGTGYVMSVSDLLRMSLGLLGDNPAKHHELIAGFYARLLTAAPELVPLFPPDLTDPTSSADGKIQRDRLLSGLIAVGQMYDPDHPDAEPMQVLCKELERLGRSHAAFQRPDGRVRGATVREYNSVGDLLLSTLGGAVGPAWVTAVNEAWDEAYDFAARGMIAGAWNAGFKSARYPRR